MSRRLISRITGNTFFADLSAFAFTLAVARCRTSAISWCDGIIRGSANTEPLSFGLGNKPD
jgi:hypothetical protein